MHQRPRRRQDRSAPSPTPWPSKTNASPTLSAEQLDDLADALIDKRGLWTDASNRRMAPAIRCSPSVMARPSGARRPGRTETPTYITAGELNEARASQHLAPSQLDVGHRHRNLLDDLYLRHTPPRHVRGVDDEATTGGEKQISGSPPKTSRPGFGISSPTPPPGSEARHRRSRPWPRFHHRLVAIHPFPNGNGRHGRQTADYLCLALGQPPFTWGRHLSQQTPQLRAAASMPLRAADSGNLDALVGFAHN